MPRIRKTKFQQVSKTIIWLIGIYIRLSREDGNDESLSVTNQKKIILEYLETNFSGDYELIDIYVDDGVTGTDSERPEFQRMIQDAESGHINCVICKNLSRMFRNYADQGYYLEDKFPQCGIRMIAISNPHVDSYASPETIGGLEVPINGLLNDRYAAKTSQDIRNTFNMKRRKGEFIGAFAPYGYQKDPTNKNKLIIDEEAAQVVRDIYTWFVVDGMSKTGIAKKLNEEGVPNPLTYKHAKGLKLNNPNQVYGEAGKYWVPKTVSIILKNKMYIGTMVQGKQLVISYKVHTKISVPEDKWYEVENTHDPIISKEMFQKAQNLNEKDTRTAPGKWTLHLFAGYICCYDCKRNLRRTHVKGYSYYLCRTFRDMSNKLCTKHSIREDKLYLIVLTVIQKQIELIGNMEKIITAINKAPVIQTKSARLESMKTQRKKELEKAMNIKDSLYGDWKAEVITKEEYVRLKEKYDNQISQLQSTLNSLEKEINLMEQGIKSDNPYFSTFLKYGNITELTRGILVDLVEKIYVHENKELDIVFRFSDQHKLILEFIENNKQVLNVK